MTPTAYIIPADLYEGLKSYLMQRPWHEVAAAMPRLLALKPAPAPGPTESANVEKKEPVPPPNL